MKNLSVRRAVAGLSLAALAGVGLVSVPSAAHAAVEKAMIGGAHGLSAWNCEGDSEGAQLDTIPWSDDNVAVTKSGSAAETYTYDEADSVDVAVSSTATITSSPLGNGPATITGTATAKASITPSGAETKCQAMAQATGLAQGVFTLTKPMWVTVSATGQGGDRQGNAFGTSLVGIGSADLIGASLESLLLFGGDGLMVSAGSRGTATSSTLLQPGKYSVAFGSVAYAVAYAELPESETSAGLGGSATYTGSFKVEFSDAGAATPVTGKGAAKVQFGERDCASGNVPIHLTKKTVKQAKRVAVRVNGAKGQVLKGKSLKGKKPKARTLLVPTSASGVTKVKVKITLANGRRVQATRSYLPCR